MPPYRSEFPGVRMSARKTAGAKFRASFLGEFEAPGLLYGQLLTAVCSTLDLVEDLEAEVAHGGLTVPGSRGQAVINPAVVELRYQRAALSKLLAAMDLNDEGQNPGSALSNLRWKKPR